MIFRKWGGGGVKGRLELFRKFIRFGIFTRPLEMWKMLNIYRLKRFIAQKDYQNMLLTKKPSGKFDKQFCTTV